MALVVFLKGINVGGYRKIRPSEVAKRLKRYDVVNVGAAGTFVVRKSVAQRKLRTDLKGLLPFETQIMICRGNEIRRLAATNPFSERERDRDTIQFVSVLARRPASRWTMPVAIPAHGAWGLRVLECRNRFIIGVHRRQMKAIGHLGQLEKILGVPITTRSWNTIQTIARILDSEK